MMIDSHDFCRRMLSFSRLDAKDLGVALPKVASAKMREERYAVFIGGIFQGAHDACCAFSARRGAIDEYVEERMKDDE